MHKITGDTDGARYVVQDYITHGSGPAAHSETIERHYARTQADARKVLRAWAASVGMMTMTFPGASEHKVWQRETGTGPDTKTFHHTRVTRKRYLTVHKLPAPITPEV